MGCGAKNSGAGFFAENATGNLLTNGVTLCHIMLLGVTSLLFLLPDGFPIAERWLSVSRYRPLAQRSAASDGRWKPGRIA
jgi:hypothetical protein